MTVSKKKVGKTILTIVTALVVIFVAVSLNSLVETNDQGNYQVKQAAITGEMTVRMNPGTYMQWFGTISEYRAVATVGFGNQQGEGKADIAAVPVIFSDGSKAEISGLVRIRLPGTAEELIALKKEYAGGYDHFILAGVIPVIENAVKLSANLRTAQDAYTPLAIFQQAIDDQLENGIYLTKSTTKDFVTATGDIETRQITEILTDADGVYMRKTNRLQELNCEVTECVIDVPAFGPAVERMISLRKDEAMKTELSKQSAIRARQDAITAEEEGKAYVAIAKYEREVELIKEVTDARRNFEVAQFAAKQALEEKKAKISIAEGVKQELLIADGLSARAKYQIDANVKRDIGVAEYMSNWVGPQIVMAGGNDGSGGSGIEKALMIQMMQNLIKTPATK